MLRQLRTKDVLIVWKLDRLSRSLEELLHLMEPLLIISPNDPPAMVNRPIGARPEQGGWCSLAAE